MRYLNVDPGGNPARFNSSTATLSVPAGASVAQAFLYWGADLARGVTSNTANDGAPGGENPSTNTLWQHSVPEDGHRPLHDDRRDTGRPPRSREGHRELVRTAGQPPRLRLPGTSRRDQRDPSRGGLDDSPFEPRREPRRCHRGERAGRYRQQPPRRLDPRRGVGEQRAPWRNLTLFDGFDFVQVSGRPATRGRPAAVQRLQDTVERAMSMRTSPRGPTRPTATSSATTCRSALPPTRARTSAYRVHDALNPVDNFFNSSISRGGVTRHVQGSGLENQLGFDIDAPSIPEGTIKNGATGAAVCLGTNGDTYFFGGLAFDTLIRAPNLSIAKTVNTAHAEPGRRRHLYGHGHEPAAAGGSDADGRRHECRGIRSHPIRARLRRFVVNPTARPPGRQVPACGYSAAAISIIARPASHSRPTLRSPTSSRARVTAPRRAPLTPILNTACFRANSQDQPTTNFTGCDSANIYVKLPPVAGADRRSRRDEDGLGDNRQAGRQSRLGTRCTQLRARCVEQLHRDRRTSEQCRLRESGDEPERPDVHDAARRLERRRSPVRLRRQAFRRSRRRQRVHAHDRRAGLGRHRRRNGACERR